MSLAEDLAGMIVSGRPFVFMLGAEASANADIPTDKRGERGIAWALAIRHTGDAEEGRRIFGTEIILANLFPEIS
jgi:hypothetical protein